MKSSVRKKKTRADESVESNKIVKSSAHLKSSELVKSCMMIMMMMNDGDDDDARPLSCKMSESIELLTHIDAGRGQDPLEDACLERQRMREFNGLFCQIALGDHNV